MSLNFAIEIEREDDGRWIAEIPSLPGVMAYGNSEEEAIRSVQALALHVLADRVSQGTADKDLVVSFACSR